MIHVNSVDVVDDKNLGTTTGQKNDLGLIQHEKECELNQFFFFGPIEDVWYTGL